MATRLFARMLGFCHKPWHLWHRHAGHTELSGKGALDVFVIQNMSTSNSLLFSNVYIRMFVDDKWWFIDYIECGESKIGTLFDWNYSCSAFALPLCMQTGLRNQAHPPHHYRHWHLRVHFWIFLESIFASNHLLWLLHRLLASKHLPPFQTTWARTSLTRTKLFAHSPR